MDPSKKRKSDENGIIISTDLDTTTPLQPLAPSDARKVIEPLTRDQLLSILQEAVVRHPEVLSAVRMAADIDPSHRKLFIRGIGSETTTDSIRSVFSPYGELEEAVVIADKITGKSKGYGFVTFRHVDGAILALKQKSKRIDGRMAVAQLAASGSGGPEAHDVVSRKIYVGNIPVQISAERLLDFFSAFGDIEEGPIGFDKQAGKPKGFVFFVYCTEEGAKACLMEPMKNIDGSQVMCRLAVDGKKGKGSNPDAGVSNDGAGERMGSINPQFGGQMYSGYGQGMQNSSYPSSMGGPGMGQGYGPGPGSYMGGSQYGGPASGDYNSQRMPPPNSAMPAAGGYQEAGPYGYGSGGYQSQHNPGSQPLQGPNGGMYQRIPPPYY